MTTSRICIMGAGVSGLSVAHELIKQNFDVIVIERNPIAGGLARSTNFPEGPGEYGWRAYGPGYLNLQKIMSEIPISEDKTVLDNLQPVNNYTILRQNGTQIVFDSSVSVWKKLLNIFKITRKFTIKDYLIILKLFLYTKTSCSARIISLDTIAWYYYVSGFSSEAKKFLVNPIGIFYGMEVKRMSTTSVLSLADNFLQFTTGAPFSFSAMKGPTNDAWLNPWVKYLTDKGVNFQFNTEIHGIDCDSHGNITKVFTSDGDIKADIFVSSLPTESNAKIFENNTKLHCQFKALAENSKQVQPSIAYYFDDIITFSHGYAVIYLVDTPWNLMILPQGKLWREGGYWPPDSTFGKDCWGIGIGNSNNPGTTGKSFTESTREEAIEEVWKQCLQSNILNLNAKTESGKPLAEIKNTGHCLWPSFQTNKDTNKLDTWEPKFSNNAYTYTDLPDSTKNPYVPNLYIATAYNKEYGHVYNMEAAAFFGRRTARYISNSTEPEITSVPDPDNNFFKYIDYFCYKVGLPNSLITLTAITGIIGVIAWTF